VQLSFENRTYLVTGGGSGIGKGVAAGLVSSGASVMIVGRNPDRLAAAVEDIEARQVDGSIRYEPADVTNEEEAVRAVDATTAWHGRLHGVVHCAGGSDTIGPITQIGSLAPHGRPQHQRHHVCAQARRA
jgi:NAD(P)-dependent dehydrogenase (short-subunit alcohol dehydrogenase family)